MSTDPAPHTHAVILSIGDEIAQGESLDTNTQWLARELVSGRIAIAAHVTAPDDLETLARVFRECAGRAPLVISTGGLGPTQDDLTRQALALAGGEELVRDDAALREIESWFAARGRDVLAMNTVQAMRPESGRCLPNPHGTAPGIWARVGSADVFCLPGPPREMRPMFRDHVESALRIDRSRSIVLRTFVTAGISESSVAQRLGETMARDRNPNVATTASLGVVTCRLRYEGTESEGSLRVVDEMAGRVREALGAYLIGEGDASPESAVVEALQERGAMLVTAESCTGGLISEMVTNVPGSSAVFHGGFVSYSNEFKVAHLGVDPRTIEEHGAVSERTAREMALGAIERSAIVGEREILSVAVTGVAGPSGGSDEKPVGTVWIATAHRAANGEHRVDARRFLFPGGRSAIRRRTAISALLMVRSVAVGTTAPAILWEQA